jgi:acyl-CoA thioester hydrolase
MVDRPGQRSPGLDVNESQARRAFVAWRGVVHPWLCDAMGHLTTRAYVAMFDDATYHLLFAAFGYAPGRAEWEGRGWADVKQELTYKLEVSAGELVWIEARLLRLGTTSLTGEYSLHRAVDDSEAATFVGTTVFFDLQARRGIELTPAMRERARRWLDDDSHRGSA